VGVEFEVTGLATDYVPFGDDIKGKPGAFYGFGGEEFAGEVEGCAFGVVREDEDGQVAFPLRGRSITAVFESIQYNCLVILVPALLLWTIKKGIEKYPACCPILKQGRFNFQVQL